MHTIGGPRAVDLSKKERSWRAGDYNPNPEESVKIVGSKPKDSVIFPQTKSQVGIDTKR